MRAFFVWLVLGLLLGDAAWWWRADVWLRAGSARAWAGGRSGGAWRGVFWDGVFWRGVLSWGRWFLGGFMVSVMGGLLGLVGMRWSGAFAESAFPSGWFALVYVWHLMVLPAVLLLWAAWKVAGVAKGCWQRGRDFFQCGRVRVEGVPGGGKEGGDSDGRCSAAGCSASPDAGCSDSQQQRWGAERELWGTRRDFLGAVAGMTPAGLALGLTERGLGLMEEFRVRRLEVVLSGLPEGLEGFRIAHVSDLHVGRFTKGRVLERIVEATNALEADLVAFTGDLVNYSLEDLPAGLELLGALRGKLGVVAVEGNHDLLVDGARFRRTTSGVVPLLVDESLSLNCRGVELEVLGLGWGSDVEWLRKRSMLGESGLLSGGASPPGRFPILLAHHPHVFDGAEGIALTLSGHTHGGQLMVTERLGVGPMMFRYWSGLYRRGERALVVSNGVGNWFPVRTRAPAEVVEVVLRRGNG